MLRVAVIGGSNGQLARSLAEAADAGCAVSLLGRPQVDLNEPAALSGLLRDLAPQIVVNAAAYTAVDRAQSEQDAALPLHPAGTAADTGRPGRRERRVR